MNDSEKRAESDRRQGGPDRRRRFIDRRRSASRFHGTAWPWRAIRYLTGPWTSANGLSWFWVIAIILIVRWAALELFMIPSHSMEPTLHGDPRYTQADRIAVNKLAFGLRMPFTGEQLFKFGEPKRWDIVVFDSVEDGMGREVVVKRVVGLPGEKVQISDQKIFINDTEIELPAELEGRPFTRNLSTAVSVVQNTMLNFAIRKELPRGIMNSGSAAVTRLKEDIEMLHPLVKDLSLYDLTADEKQALLIDVSKQSIAEIRRWLKVSITPIGHAKYGVLLKSQYSIVPQDHYFCLGDNSPESVDGRYFGWVPHENLIGRAYGVVIPFSRMRDLSGFTATFRGKVILYGIPIVLLLWEILPGFILFSWKLRGPVSALGLESGDHVIVNRISFGLRIPFLKRRFRQSRNPKVNEVVCYSLSDRPSERLDLYFGDVREIDDSGHAIVRGPGGDSDRWITLDNTSLVGKAVRIWWPLNRSGRVVARKE